ncbi:flagellar filament capping protein FliD [Fusibacter sp. JL216-2]|uniref:flagellar filament capping protein FliD n=1 Tax=Fusibacter sp. JL216-2 TaxID=3071453 RepID=UPI003D333181
MSVTRITGLTSGIDTDSMIKDLMKLEQSKIDNVEKQKTLVEWEQEAYREVINGIRAFKEEYFDFLSADTNFRSASAFSAYSESVQVNGEDVSYVSASGTSEIKTYSHTIGSISQLATQDEWVTDRTGIGDLSGDHFNFSTMPSSLEFSLTIDGNNKTISIPDTSGITTKEDLAQLIDDEIVAQFGTDYSGVVNVDPSDDAIYFRMDGSDVTIMETDGNSSELDWLGFNSGESSTDYEDKSLLQLFYISNDDLASMTINGVSLEDIGITEASTISDLSEAISSNEDMDAEFFYNSTTDKFTIRAEDFGTANTVSMSSSFMSTFGFVDDVAHHTEADNAVLEINGATIVKSSNNFSVEGVQYSLNELYDGVDGDIEIKVNIDTSDIKEKINKFVETYNGLVEMVNGKLTEKKNYDYEPLTSEEKESLSDDEVEKWETTAKKGLLRNDSSLQKMLTSMRLALYESVDGVDLNLADIGITTTANYKDGGKLVVDEDKLDDALENNYSEVVKLFTNESDKEYLDTENISERYNENGVANRLYDIIQNNIRITRDSTGVKGTLLEKAGMEGDVTSTKNLLSSLIVDYEDKIDSLWDSYYDMEDSLYIKFGNMESALAELQAQSSSLMSQLG